MMMALMRGLALPLVVSSQVAFAQNPAGVLFPLDYSDYEPLTPGTTRQMQYDWRSMDAQVLNQPDRSFRSIWIRLFPLLDVPHMDPYAETENVHKLEVGQSDLINIYGLDDGALLAQGRALAFDFRENRVTVDGRNFVLERLWLVPSNTASLTTAIWDKGLSTEVRGQYRGGFIVAPSLHKGRGGAADQTLWSLINVVSVTDYLRSVVPSEVLSSWSAETMKAQAVAARSYGLHQVATARRNGKDFDVDPSTWYQSYQGVKFWNRSVGQWRSIEGPKTDAAVLATGNRVLTYQGELIRAFFSANSGGRTCTATECFQLGVNPPYLVEVDDAPGVKQKPGGTWGARSNITQARIRAKLREIGFGSAGRVSRLQHLERGPSGRTWRLRVRMRDGSRISLSEEQTRKMMSLFGPVRSFMYELGAVNSSGKQSIVGHGFGHGVGMSQWGAQVFAEAGWNYERILLHYYVGARVAEM